MLDLPESSVIVGGLDGWKYEADQVIPVIDEPRLVDKLRGCHRCRESRGEV